MTALLLAVFFDEIPGHHTQHFLIRIFLEEKMKPPFAVTDSTTVFLLDSTIAVIDKDHDEVFSNGDEIISLPSSISEYSDYRKSILELWPWCVVHDKRLRPDSEPVKSFLSKWKIKSLMGLKLPKTVGYIDSFKEAESSAEIGGVASAKELLFINGENNEIPSAERLAKIIGIPFDQSRAENIVETAIFMGLKIASKIGNFKAAKEIYDQKYPEGIDFSIDQSIAESFVEEARVKEIESLWSKAEETSKKPLDSEATPKVLDVISSIKKLSLGTEGSFDETDEKRAQELIRQAHINDCEVSFKDAERQRLGDRFMHHVIYQFLKNAKNHADAAKIGFDYDRADKILDKVSEHAKRVAREEGLSIDMNDTEKRIEEFKAELHKSKQPQNSDKDKGLIEKIKRKIFF